MPGLWCITRQSSAFAGRIKALALRSFRPRPIWPFSCIIHTTVLPDRTRYPLHTSQFRIAYEKLPLDRPGAISDTVGA